MAHVYASLAEFKAYLSGGDVGSNRDATLLTLLDSASRTVDAFCDRGSGFGPVVETRTYYPSSRLLALGADVVHVGSLSVNEVLVAEGLYTFDGRVIFGSWGAGGTVTVHGTFGYPGTTTEPLTTLGASLDASSTSVTLDATGLGIGQIIVVGDEQMRITAIGESDITVVRGYNGTTAAAHDDEAMVSIYRYPAEVVDATLRVAQRRWKMRDAGLTGDFGGIGIPITSNQDKERTILYSTVGHLRFELVA